jgi:hypothetical protein
MKRRTIRRALAGAMTALILSAVATYADTVPADGDAVIPGNQGLVVLPDAMPGEVVTWPIDFRLTCTGTNHPAPGTTIQLDLLSASVPLDGHASATTTTIGPVPDTWTPAGASCPSPAPTLPSDGPSTVTLTMPTTPGESYLFSLMWSRFGVTSLTGSSAITFQVNVIGNTPPTLHLPADKTVEATSPAGAAVTWSATATDDEDAVAPTPSCTPASGSTLPLGTTTVGCSVTDGGGLGDAGSFDVTVVDTTAPDLVGLPADRSITTGDPSGATFAYESPTATDAADPDPEVGCLPASGSQVGVGTTTVTCTTRDASGNEATGTFTVDVTYVPDVTWSALWGEPVASNGSAFVANPGRMVPVKVELLRDGIRQTNGSAVLSVAACDGDTVASIAMSWSGGRWNASVDTSMLGASGCYSATASLDGHVAGSFRIDLRGADPATSGGPKGKAKR